MRLCMCASAYVGAWVKARARVCGRVFVDVCMCACGFACACGRGCACESLGTSALVTQLPDTFSLLLYCKPLCPVLTTYFM